MSPEEAMQMLQQLGVTPDMLPQLAAAIDVLKQAGVIPAEGAPEQGAPPDKLSAALNAAEAQHAPPQG